MIIIVGLQEESFLEDVNMILNTTDIPNLYENEERLEIVENVRRLILCFQSLIWNFIWFFIYEIVS